ncbi:hypothetical protein ONS96_011347 [Cadophora gregata f. sp. sojae]|nr:hypothetical protein ONS96_011347 [Cadophora gregata f. sp. sojae]
MSQSHPEGRIWASLPLIKFSSVTYPSNSICPTWSHLTSNNLRVVIQTSRVVDDNGAYDQRVMLRASKGSELLVSQDLERLVRIRQHDASMVEVAQISPRIAMRYPLNEGVIQKFEMRFGNNEDFIVVVEIMRSLGLPMREGGPSQKQVFQIQRTHEFPLPAPLTFMSSSPAIDRPVSASSTIIHNTSSSRAGLHQFTDFKVPERPATVESMRQRSGSSQVAPVASDSFANLSPLPTVAQARAASFREGTMSSHLSNRERENYTQRPSQPLSDEIVPGNMNTQSKPSLYIRQLQTERANKSDSLTFGSRTFSTSPFFPILPATTSQSSDPFRSDSMSISQKDISSNITIPPRADSPTSRPSFTSTKLQDLMIPPRRQLPFDRPVSTPADLQSLTVPPTRESPFSPPDLAPRSSSAIDLPPLPKPTPITKANITNLDNLGTSSGSAIVAPIKRVAQRKPRALKAANPSALSPLKTVTREMVVTPPLTRIEDAPSPLAAKSAALSRPASAASGLVSKATAPITKRVPAPIRPPSSTKRQKMIDQSTQTQTLSGRDHTVKEKLAVTNNFLEDAAALTPKLAAPPQLFLNDLDTFVANHRDRAVPQEIWQMPGYAEADAERRQVLLDDFICQNLENADFLQLCADTEVAWRRIGLGM